MPSTGKWVNRLWCVYTVECYVAITWNERLIKTITPKHLDYKNKNKKPHRNQNYMH